MPSEYDPDLATDALAQLPNRRPAGLYDIALQYAVCDWYETTLARDLGADLDSTHLLFMTPTAKAHLFGEPDNALVVHVDLTDPDDPMFRDDRPIRFESVDRSYRLRLGHSLPVNKTASMTDYSITTHKQATEHHLAGQRDDRYGTGNVLDRFTRWPRTDAADRVLQRTDEKQALILRALRTLGTSPEKLHRLVERPGCPLDPDDTETVHEVFVTIRLRLPGEDRYRWPGEIAILNDVMVERKRERFANLSVEDATGEGTGFLTGDEGEVTGGSPGLLGMYTKKQREHFPNLSVDGAEGWRMRPITPDTAAAIATANSVCKDLYHDLGNSQRLYILPYLARHPSNITPEQFHEFVIEIFSQLRTREHSALASCIDRIFYARQEPDVEPSGLFAERTESKWGQDISVATVFTSLGKLNRVFFEAVDTDVHRPREVDLAHEEVLRSPPMVDAGIFATAMHRSESPLLSRTTRRDTMALCGTYFAATTAPTRFSDNAAGTPKAGKIDGLQARRLRKFLTGDRLPLSTLLEEYVHNLVQYQRRGFTNTGVDVPTEQILEQYVQLRALREIDALGDYDGSQTIGRVTRQRPANDPPNSHPDDSDTSLTRADRLNQFLETHAMLECASREAVFLLGGLVGRITAFQRHEEISSTLVRRYPIDYLTKHSIKEVTNDVLHMNNTYIAAETQLPSTYNARYTNRLPDLMLSADPAQWSFPQNELQWLYALGITYGLNDTATTSGSS